MLKNVSESRYCIILAIDKGTSPKSYIYMGYILFMKMFVDERRISNNMSDFSILYKCPSRLNKMMAYIFTIKRFVTSHTRQGAFCK